MHTVADWLGLEVATVGRLAWSAVILLVLVAANAIARRVAVRRIADSARRYSFVKASGYVLGAVSVVSLAVIWVRGGANLATYLGILSAGIAIALQDPLTNLVGWVFIVVRRPLIVGDRVQIGEHRGDVVDIGLLQFSLIEIGNWVDADQSTGRIIHVPNGQVFRTATANYTQGFNFLWEELPVTITFESNWHRAKEILEHLAEAHSVLRSSQAAREVRQSAARFRIKYRHLTPIVWTSLADNGVTLTLRFLCEPRRRRSTASTLWEAVLDEFLSAPDIDFAYPTWRRFDNRAEGKPEAGGPPPGVATS